MLFSGNLLAQPTNFARDDFWVPDGEVRAIVETNGVLYVGGIFDYVSTVSDTGNAFDLASGAAPPGFPKVNGAIRAIVSDTVGGWFIGGLFRSVGGVPVTNLAHVRADKTLDTSWMPSPDNAVLALVFSKTMLYVGGSFFNIAGEAHSLVAALDPITGAAISGWRADVMTTFPKPSVNALALGDSRLYIGGYFSTINGVSREHVGSVDAATGALTSWWPNGYTGAQAGSRIDAVAYSENVLYVAGSFNGIGGVDNQHLANANRHYVAALDVTKDLPDSVLPWNPDASGPVTSLALSCDTVYVGGTFTNIGGQLRNRIAAVNRSTGLATPWDPNANGDVLNVTLAGNLVYVGGKFSQIGGQAREFLAALDIRSAQATLWQPKSDFGVNSIVVSGGSVVAGGVLGPGGKLRKNVAAFDTRTGVPLDWSPQITGGTPLNGTIYRGVYALAASSNMVYLGGPFTEINGQVRNHLGAVSAISGVLSNWNPNANGIVETLLNYGGVIYAGGRFSTIGGQARNNLAALDRITGAALTSWRADANDKVLALAGSGANVYCGGPFTGITNQPRNRLAGVTTNTGALLLCDPNVQSDLVSSISVFGNTMYFGGQFSAVGGQSRGRVAAVDLGTCSPICWNPDARFVVGTSTNSSGVNVVLASSNVVYVGGSFNLIGGQSRNSLAALNTNCTSDATSWNPDADGPVSALAPDRSSLYAGGTFQIIGGQYRPSLAVFPPTGSPRVTLQPASPFVSKGQPVTFTVAATGQTPLSYQWQFNGTNIANATNTSFVIAGAQATDSGDYSVVITNAIGLVHSRRGILAIVDPLSIITQPASQTVAPGATVTFSVVVGGSPPPTYQWKLNGVNIPGAFYSTLVLTNVQRTNGGSYSVVVANITGATNSAIAELIVTGPSLPFGDNLAARGVIGGSSGQGSGNNQSATSEILEPLHAGKPGGKSLWLAWTAPASGIATFHTRGSAFDTLLAVYTGANYSSLTNVVSDEDRAGYGTSEVSFNASNGVQYLIAVDGYYGVSGNVMLSWSNDTSTVPFPRIYTQPLSASVTTGAVVMLFVQVTSPSAATFQWFHECRALAGATNSILTISNVQPDDVGNYHVVVMNASSHAAQSEDAFVEIGPDSKALSKDKLEDLFLNSGGGFALQTYGPASAPSSSFIPVNAGAVGSQIFDNVGSTTQQGEPTTCGVIGGSSKWMGFYASTNAVMLIDTIGSSFDTVLAVHIGSTFANLVLIDCNNNGAPDGIRSLLKFNTVGGTPYLIAVDGVNGAQGQVSLNWKCAGTPTCISLSSNQWVPLDGSTTLSVSSNGPPPDTLYFWRRNGSVVSVSASSALSLAHMQAAQAGTYSVIMSNFAGMSTTTVATVSVALPVAISSSSTTLNGARAIRVTVPSSDSFVIEGANALVANPASTIWFPLYTNATQTGPINFTDPGSTNLLRRFYRVVPKPP